MARFGFPNLKVELDNSGGALQDISNTVTEINGWSVEAMLQEITAAGDDDDRWAYVGIKKKSEVVLTGPYDDTANKLVAVTKGAEGATRTLKLSFDENLSGHAAADVINVEAIIMRVERNPSRDQLHNYSVTLRPTGDIT